ncbi:helix-turn-helix transcriptional regulator [Thiocapsa rosea]|uniref:Helix-turn-helix protein n=1 Tax=Thiocapsa rosea TaxID=69360 RepID=A0A495UKP6_9GAMM|nr:helix-turn-helix domain-containing protein [Thiocapsa rosea]RKT37876.1 helix-turn-helix protein [Thiocapsa rosea]
MNGERLREARLRAGLNQTELGRRVGLSQSMIGAIERSDRSATPETAQALADALGIALDSLADSAGHLPDSPDALLENQHTAEGLRELASDRVLAASLDILPSEWRALRSLVLPTPATKDGYIALLITIRLVTGGRGTPSRDSTESP